MPRDETRKPGPAVEKVFSRIPGTIPGIKDMLGEGKGWIGFNTPFSQVLRPLFLGRESQRNADLTVVDFGCGWGEHISLAGIGLPGGDVPKVTRAIGLNADAVETQRAQVLSKFAQMDPGTFRMLIQTADIGMGIGAPSPTVERMQHILTDPALSDEFSQIVNSNNSRELETFIRKYLHESPDASSMGFFGTAGEQGNIQFLNTNIFNPDLPSDFADGIISSSVSSYIADPKNETEMWRNILRIARRGATINALSYEYQRDTGLTSAPRELSMTAQAIGVRLDEIQNRDHLQSDTIIRHRIFEVASKP